MMVGKRVKKRFCVVFSVLVLSILTLAGTVIYRYDSAGRLIRADYGDGKRIYYSYDPAGNILVRSVFIPCFDWAAFLSRLPNWHDTETMLTLVAAVECPKTSATRVQAAPQPKGEVP